MRQHHRRLAAAEKIDRSYLSSVLGLTLLAPEFIEAVLDGRQAEAARLPAPMKGLLLEWQEQSTPPKESSK